MSTRIARVYRSCLASLMLVAPTTAGTSSWIGATSTDWFEASNWSAGVPTAGDAAVIEAQTLFSATVTGTTAACAQLDVEQDATLTIAAGANLSAGSSGSDLRGSIAGAGTLVLTGSGTLRFHELTSLPNVRVAGSGLIHFQPSTNQRELTIDGSLTHDSGDLSLAGSTLVTVTGSASLQAVGDELIGASENDPTLHGLHVQGDVSFAGTSADTPPPIRCAGSWTSDAAFAPSAGSVLLDADGAQTVSLAAGSRFHSLQVGTATSFSPAEALILDGDLSVAGQLTMNSWSLAVGGELLVAGILTTAASVTVAGKTEITARASVDLGPGTHEFDADFDVQATASFATTGLVRFVSHGIVKLRDFQAFHDVEVDVGGTSSVHFQSEAANDVLAVGGSLTLRSGRLSVSGPDTLRVAADALFLGGALVSSTGKIDVEGGVTFAGTTPTQHPELRCAGTWSSDADYANVLTFGHVIFDGPSGQQLTTTEPTLRLFEATIGATSSVVMSTALETIDELTVEGTLEATNLETGARLTVHGELILSGRLDAGAQVKVGALGRLDLGSEVHDIGAGLDVDATAQLLATGQLVFDGQGAVDVRGGQLLPALEIAAPGAIVDLSNSASSALLVVQSFRLSSGTARLRGDTLRVLGLVELTGGALTNLSGGTLDADGGVVISATQLTTPPDIHCSGSWSSGASFAPTSGEVVFDGSATQTPVTTAPSPLRFNQMRVVQGSVVDLDEPLEIRTRLDVDGLLTTSAGIDTDAASSLFVTDRLEIGGVLDANGNVSVSGSGTLDLGSGTHELAANLTVSGTASLLAQGTLCFDGAGIVNVQELQVLPSVLVDATGTVTFRDDGDGLLVISQELDVVDGALSVWTGDRLRVGQDARFGPAATLLGPGSLDLDGAAQFDAPTLTSSPEIDCAGAFASSGSLAGARVVLDGSGPQSAITTEPSFDFEDLSIAASASVTLQSPLALGGDLEVAGMLLVDFPAVVGDALTVDGELHAADTLGVGGPLTIAGVLTTSSTLTAFDDLTLASGGMLDLGAAIHELAADLTIDEAASFSSSGGLRFVGGGTVTVGGPNRLPNVEIAAAGAGQIRFRHSRSASPPPVPIDGTLQLLSGTLYVWPAHTLRVSGQASFLGGALSATSGFLDLDGGADLQFQSTRTASPNIRCAASWTSNGNFVPSTGEISFDGDQPQQPTSASGVLEFNDLEIGPLADVALSISLQVDGSLSVLGSLSTTADLTTQEPGCGICGSTQIEGEMRVSAPASWTSYGDVTVKDRASLDLADGTHAFDGDLRFDSTADLSATGTLHLTGSGLVKTRDLLQLPAIQIDANAGLIEFDGGDVLHVATLASLTQLGGILRPYSGETLRVLGPASFQDASLFPQSPTTTVFDFDGGASFLRTNLLSSSPMRCAGDWVADDQLQPTQPVLFDGYGTSTLAASAGLLHFASLSLANGERRLTGAIELSTGALTVQRGAALELREHRLLVPAATVTVDGRLAVGPGGELALGPATSVQVGLSGTLSLGVPTAPIPVSTGAGSGAVQAGALGRISGAPVAAVRAFPSGGWSISIDGELEAAGFLFESPGLAGVALSNSTRIAPFPYDLRDGSFARPMSGQDSVLLQLDLALPASFHDISFDDPDDDGTYNAHVPLGGAAVSFVNASGDFSGELYENDPGDLIDWTTLGLETPPFTARAGVLSVVLGWFATAGERFRIEARVADRDEVRVVARGASRTPGPRVVVDRGLEAGQTYVYRLVVSGEEGASERVARAAAIPLPSATAARSRGSWRVGPGGRFANVQAALAALGSLEQARVLIAPGVYPSFSIDAPAVQRLRLEAEGDVVIDTRSGPIVIRQLQEKNAVTLSGLELRAGEGSAQVLSIEDCAGLVLLDELRVVDGPTPASLDVRSSRRVVLQDCGLETAELRLQRATQVHFHAGGLASLRAEGNSRAIVVGIDAQLHVEPDSSVVVLAERPPRLELERPSASSSGRQEQELHHLLLRARAGSRWMLSGADDHGWRSLPGAGYLDLLAPDGRRPIAAGVLEQNELRLTLSSSNPPAWLQALVYDSRTARWSCTGLLPVYID